MAWKLNTHPLEMWILIPCRQKRELNLCHISWAVSLIAVLCVEEGSIFYHRPFALTTQTLVIWGLQGGIYSSVLLPEFLYLLAPDSCIWFSVGFRQTIVLLVNFIRSQFAVPGLGNVKWCWRQWLLITPLNWYLPSNSYPIHYIGM